MRGEEKRRNEPEQVQTNEKNSENKKRKEQIRSDKEHEGTWNTEMEWDEYEYDNTTLQETEMTDSVRYDTTQHNTTQHNTTQYNTTQYNTTQHNTTQHNTTQLISINGAPNYFLSSYYWRTFRQRQNNHNLELTDVGVSPSGISSGVS